MRSISSRAQPVEDDDVVDAVQELGPERPPQLRHHLARARPGRSQSSMNWLPTLEVMMTTVLRKSTVRPWPSVRRPSSSSCSSDVEHVGVGLLDLVEQHHRVGPPAHRLGQLAALVVADVAGRRADQARDRVLLHVLGHVDADHVGLVVEQELGQRARQLGLADAGRPQEDERADRAGWGPAARRARGGRRWRPRSTASSWPTTRGCRRSSMWQQLRLLALQHLVDRDAGPLRDDRGDVLLGDLLAQERAVLLQPP